MFMMFKSTSNTSLKMHADVHGTESKVGLLGQKSPENVSLLYFLSCFNSVAPVICEEGTEIFQNSPGLPFSV